MKMALGYVSHLHRSGIPNLFFLPYTLADGISSQITLSLHTLRIFQGLPCLLLSLSVSPFFKVVFLEMYM